MTSALLKKIALFSYIVNKSQEITQTINVLAHLSVLSSQPAGHLFLLLIEIFKNKGNKLIYV